MHPKNENLEPNLGIVGGDKWNKFNVSIPTGYENFSLVEFTTAFPNDVPYIGNFLLFQILTASVSCLGTDENI